MDGTVRFRIVKLVVLQVQGRLAFRALEAGLVPITIGRN